MLVFISFIGYIRCVWGHNILRSLILIFCQNLWNIVQAPKRTPSSLLLGTQVSHQTPGPGPLTPSLPGKPAVNFDPCLDTVKFGLKIVDSKHVFEQSQCFWPIFRYPKSCSESKRFRSPGSFSGLLFWPYSSESLWQGSCRLHYTATEQTTSQNFYHGDIIINGKAI